MEDVGCVGVAVVACAGGVGFGVGVEGVIACVGFGVEMTIGGGSVLRRGRESSLLRAGALGRIAAAGGGGGPLGVFARA